MQSSHLLHPSDAPLWIEEFQQAYLMQHEPVTVRVYVHILHQFTQWTMKQSGKTIIFQLEQHLTTPLIEQYLAFLTTQGYSQSHCKRVKSVIHQFCQWLIEDKGHLRRNPTRPIVPSSSNLFHQSPLVGSLLFNDTFCKLLSSRTPNAGKPFSR